ncbi:xanthine dehydrogenase family protein molybdopterin-binding subunit (plasmid) [Pseudonocardia bannensis]|uniref:Xanthine dehydrogenase family protein n=1 Tax=Pseudonocardia bannensis TaxID=630973 RepID=A0A848DM19_9PSEU|nr:xanthine dehydrogenase family protein molybdopterin-binding subunit [Pseudonocardia bannensis]NMH93807.1 xanthine dehydrogenase family protein [Pseudonocardia bannensis]
MSETIIESHLAIRKDKWIGKPTKRVEDPRYLTGTARYVADLELPRMLHAVYVRSPHPHARILSVDTSVLPGLGKSVWVFTGQDLRDVPPLIDHVALDNLLRTPQNVIAIDKVRFVGDAVAVVVAGDRYAAEDAAEQLSAAVEYEVLPPVPSVEAANAPGAALLFDDLGTNEIYRQTEKHGDTEKAFAAADRVFTTRFHHNRYGAAPMETRGVLANYERSEQQLTVWSSTQMPHFLRSVIAGQLGLPEHRVRVIAPEVGGGFGQKMCTSPEEIAIPFIALQLGRPVKWIEDRHEHLLAATQAKEEFINLEVAVSNEGKLLGVRGEFIGDGGGYSFNTESALIEPALAAKSFPGPYRIEAFDEEVAASLTNKSPVAAYRGVGWTAANTVREIMIDEIARELGIDPVEIRRRNMLRSDELPYRSVTGQLYDSGSYLESLELAMKTVDYDAFRTMQERLREQGRYLGLGISSYVEQTAWGSDSSAQAGTPLPSHDNSTVTVDPSGTVTVAVSTSCHGQGHETSYAQIAADGLGVDMADVKVVFGDTLTSPYGLGTYASRSAVIGGATVARASADVREQILKVAANMLEANPDDLVIEDGTISVAGTPSVSKTLAEVAYAAYWDSEVRSDEPMLTSTRFYDPPATYANGCVVVLAEVDADTGVVTLDRIVAIEDCGTVINPMIVEAQVQGAIVQGIGGALFEQFVYGDDGQPLTTTYMDYLIPTSTDVPPIEVLSLESPSPFSIGGIKGMGEGGQIAAPAAVANAVADALAPFGARVRKLPLAPDYVLRLMGKIGSPNG